MSQKEKQTTKYMSIRVSPSAKTKIKMMSSREGRSETDFANTMIDFVSKTGVDIYATATPNIPDLIKTSNNRIIAFLKKREQDFFVPMDKSFKKMIELHTRTFESLEVLDAMQLKAPTVQDFKVPEEREAEKEEEGPGSEGTADPQHVEKEEELLGKIQRAEKERDVFESELRFLMENIKPSKSISGPKFVLNLYQKDLDRIKNLIDGH